MQATGVLRERVPQSNRWPKLLAVGAIVVLVPGYVLWMRTARQTVDSSIAGLVVSQELLDFGEVWSDRDFQWRLRVHNTTGSAIEVSDIGADCQCTWVSPRSFVVPAHGSVDLHLVLDLTGRDFPETASEWRDLTTRVRPVIKRGLPNQSGWELRGRIHHAFEVSARKIRFEGAEQLVRGTRFSSKRVQVRSHIPLQRLVVQTDSEMGSAWVRRCENPLEFEVDILPSESLPEGSFNFEVTMRGVTPGDQVLPGIDVAVSGTVSPGIQAFPGLVQFGAHPLGTKAEELVTVRSISGIEFRIDSAATDCNSFAVEPTQVASMASQHTFRLSSHFEKAGESKGNVKFVVRDQNDEFHAVVVEVSGYALGLKTQESNELKPAAGERE